MASEMWISVSIRDVQRRSGVCMESFGWDKQFVGTSVQHLCINPHPLILGSTIFTQTRGVFFELEI